MHDEDGSIHQQPTAMRRISHRDVLSSTSVTLLLAVSSKASAVAIKSTPPWVPFDASPPPAAGPGGWYFFTGEEAVAVEAIVERLVPADGFPGARYDYRHYVDQHTAKLDIPPLGIAGRPEWKAKV